MENEEYEIYEEFFDEMIGRIEKNTPAYGNSWMIVNIKNLWSKLIEKVSKCIVPVNKDELDKELVDLANYCMLLWLRRNNEYNLTVNKENEKRCDLCKNFKQKWYEEYIFSEPTGRIGMYCKLKKIWINGTLSTAKDCKEYKPKRYDNKNE